MPPMARTITVPKGTYQVTWTIPASWHGPQSGSTTLEVPSGTIVVSDPCYIMEDDDWDEWLELTDSGTSLKATNAFVIDSMGGDGCYTVKLNLIRQCLKNGVNVTVST